MAQASVMAALSAATAIVAVVVPFAAGLSLLGTVPMGLVAYRYRFRVLVAATIAGSLIAFLVAGMGGMMTVLECAYIGGLVGLVKRRNRGTPTVIVVGACAGVAFGAVSVGALKVLARLRNLIFESITANVNGVARALSHVPYMQPVSERMK
ncbi:MAG TPA: cobalt ABC transporter ATP-binding protein, partial [Mycobacterium sp.]|nr:cobalt ABC transporter ATP-binding protein [Mycobacterium sp.]